MNSFAERAGAKEGRPCNWERGQEEEAGVGQKEDRPPPFPSSEPLDYLSC